MVSMLLHNLSEEYEVHLVLQNDTLFYDIPKTLPVHYLERSRADESGMKKLLKLPLLAFRYRRFLRRHGIDCSLSFLSRPNYINVLAKYLGAKTKVIISERSMFSLHYGYGDPQSFINKKLVRLYDGADRIIANSKGNAEDLRRSFGIKTPITTIYNFVETVRCDKTIDKDKNPFIFITIGRMDAGKNHKLLIEALRRLPSNCELWIIGDGALRDTLQALADDRVKFLGRKKDIFSYLNRAHCFVFGSNHEGFPNVLLEALTCKLPIISTDCRSGPREILAPATDFRHQTDTIEYAEFGILTPVGDSEAMAEAMKRLYDDDDLAQTYRNKAKIRAKDFHKEKILHQYTKVIDAIT